MGCKKKATIREGEISTKCRLKIRGGAIQREKTINLDKI
jgi:hypothetical protein